MIYIVSSKKAAALGLGQKNAWVTLLPQIRKGELFQADDQVYLDISGLTPAMLKKIIEVLNKNTAFWGVIDPKGAADDPASFFFSGASDYIGSALVKKGLSKKRFEAAFLWAQSRKSAGSVAVAKEEGKRKSQKLPAGKFEGWKSIRTGTSGSFLFLFVSVLGKSNIRTMVGEAAFVTLKNQLRDLLQQSFKEADALLWMETEGNCLFLVPPRAANGKAAVETALKMILNSRLLGVEKLGLTIPVDFTFALHYGQTAFQAPGKTGAVISESVNYIFHLGMKRAEAGRLTMSDDVPGEVIPEGLKDMFSPAGVFEGIPVRQSRRFVFK